MGYNPNLSENFPSFRREARLLEGRALRLAYDKCCSIARSHERSGNEREFLRWEMLAAELAETALDFDWRQTKKEV